MQAKKYEDLIHRLEARALKNHDLLRWQIVAYIAWGYVIMAAIFGLCIVFGLALFGRFSGRASLYFTFGFTFAKGLAKGLFWKPEPSTDHPVDRATLAPLLNLVDEVCQELKAPPIDTVMISMQCNASARKRPIPKRFGAFQNEIVIGLPLLATLDREELKGVIAHEIGHIRHGHNRFILRVIRVCNAWEEALKGARAKGLDARMLAKIVKSYFSWLNAAQIVLSRTNEREANQAEVDIVGAEVCARIRVALAIAGPETQKATDELALASFAQDSPPTEMGSNLYESLRRPFDLTSCQQRAIEVLNAPIDPLSSHPNMRQIFQTAGVDPTAAKVSDLTSQIVQPRTSAGESVFGSKLAELLRAVDNDWLIKNGDRWKKHRDAYHHVQRQVDALLEGVRKLPPTKEEAIQLAEKLLQLGRPEQSRIWIEPVKDYNFDSRFLYALILKELKDPSWVSTMENVAQEKKHTLPASDILIRHYTELGDRSEVQKHVGVIQDAQKFDEKAGENFGNLSSFWILLNCNWTEHEKNALITLLTYQRGVAKAYLFDRTTVDPRHRNTVLVVTPHFFLAVDKKTLMTRLTKIGYPRRLTIFVLDKVSKEVLDLPNALVYQRTRKGVQKAA